MEENELNVVSTGNAPSAAEKRKAFLKRFLITLAAGVALAAGFMFLLGAFSKETPKDTFHALCDACFVSGVLIAGVGLLVISANAGTFTMLGYSVSLWFKLLRKDLSSESRSYYEYRKRRLEKKSPYLHYLCAGAVLMLAALVLFIIYSSK
ncbi:MAG: DUF3899 domain-containing protein [Clostridia bacterium]|nr:DUF3899 domain-containing protein [Clostridia bacterium]